MTISLFSQDGCSDSAKVRSWLEQQGVTYVERNVSRDQTAAGELIATGMLATPLVVCGTLRVFGFRPSELAELVDANSDAPGGSP